MSTEKDGTVETNNNLTVKCTQVTLTKGLEPCGGTVGKDGRCTSCNSIAKLEQYHYEITQRKEGGFILLDKTANAPIHFFENLNDSNQNTIKRITKLPDLVISTAIAEIEQQTFLLAYNPKIVNTIDWKKKYQDLKFTNPIFNEVRDINLTLTTTDDKDRRKLVPESVAVERILSIPQINVVVDKDSKQVYVWVEKIGIYRCDGEEILQTIINFACEELASTKYTSEVINQIKHKIQGTLTSSTKIAVQNGILNLAEGTLEPFSKNEFVTNKLQVTFKKDAVSQKWLKFIDEVCPIDKSLLQEWSGYILIKGYPKHAIMWLYGATGRNGKGTWERTIKEILGVENCSSISIGEFNSDHRFSIYGLHNSLLNICSEPDADKTLTVEMLQALTGEDPVDAEIKCVQKRKKFVNGAKMTVLGNRFPNVLNPTTAWWDRTQTCNFPNRFVEEKQIVNIEKQWLDDPEERSAILNWMIEGAQRLIKNNFRFTETKTRKETILQFKRASNSIESFIEECVIKNPTFTISKAQIYDHYVNYCEKVKVIPESRNKLNKGLSELSCVRAETIWDNGTEKVWRGLYVKPFQPEPQTAPLSDITNITTSLTPTEFLHSIEKEEEKKGEKGEGNGESGNFGNAGNGDISEKSGNNGNNGNVDLLESAMKASGIFFPQLQSQGEKQNKGSEG